LALSQADLNSAEVVSMSVLALSKEISTYLISDLQPKKSNTAPNTDAKANFFISIYSVIANIRVFKITLFVFGKKGI
jgi:hypothetical protein